MRHYSPTTPQDPNNNDDINRNNNNTNIQIASIFHRSFLQKPLQSIACPKSLSSTTILSSLEGPPSLSTINNDTTSSTPLSLHQISNNLSSFQDFVSEILIQDPSQMNSLIASVNQPFPWDTLHSPPIPLLRTKVRRYEISIELLSLLHVRISEGFGIENIVQRGSRTGSLSSSGNLDNLEIIQIHQTIIVQTFTHISTLLFM